MNKKSVLSTVVFVCVLSLVVVGGAKGATITVKGDGTGDYTTIQAAFNAAQESDTIVVSPGHYLENLSLRDKNVVLTSVSPDDPCNVSATIIDGDKIGITISCATNIGPAMIIRGFTITGGKGGLSRPGGISCWGSPTIDKCVIKENEGDQGGGIRCVGSSPIITHCIIEDNDTTYNGDGGGIGFDGGGSPTISHCIIRGNSALGTGGGIYCAGSSNPVFSNCVIENNTAGPFGGGVYCYNAYDGITFTNCIIRNNSAGLNPRGGGIHCYFASKLSSNNCTITANTGGVYSESSSITMKNCIVWGNSTSDIWGDTIYVTYSNIGGGAIGQGNINADPCFVSGLEGDYYLSQIAAGQSVNSPCVDAGSDTAGALGLDMLTTRTDEVGDAGIVDMGYHYAPPNPADFNGDGVVNFFDFSVLGDAWMSGVGDLNWDPACDISEPNDNFIDGLDLDVFTDNYLEGID